VFACVGWKHNDLWNTQTTNNLNKRLAFAFAEIQTAQKRIEIEKYFELFEVKEIDIKEDLNNASGHFPTNI
jgi:acetolactate synthase small subunit